MLNISFYLSRVKYSMLLISDSIVIVVRRFLYLILKLKHEALM